MNFIRKGNIPMKNNRAVLLCASVIALTACSTSEANVGSRDDIIVKNRGDVSTVQVADIQKSADTAPILQPAASIEAQSAASVEVTPIQPVDTVIPPTAPAVVGAPAAVASGDVIIPVSTPSVASGDIVVEVPEMPVKISADDAQSVSNVVTEHQGVDKFPPVQPIVTENQAIDSAAEAAEQIIIAPQIPASKSSERVSPYIQTY